MKLNTIQREGRWSSIADQLNENFAKMDNAVEALNTATIKNIGYFATVDALREAYPIASAGAKAYVGVAYPFAIYLWDAATSTWMDSGETGGEESVNLGDYYTKEETDAKVAELESEVNGIDYTQLQYVDIHKGYAYYSEGVAGNNISDYFQSSGGKSTIWLSKADIPEKMDALSYSLLAGVGPSISSIMWAVTDASGTILAVKNIADGGASYSGTINLASLNAPAEIYFAHHKDATPTISVSKKGIADDVNFLTEKVAVMESEINTLQTNYLKGEAFGKGDEWAKITIPVPEDIEYSLCLSGDITDATMEGQASFLQYVIKDKGGEKIATNAIALRGETFNSGKVVSLSTYRGQMSEVIVEGRWHEDEKLIAHLIPDLRAQDIDSLKNSLGISPIAKASKEGNDESWAQFSLNLGLIKAGSPLKFRLEGNITCMAVDGQIFLAYIIEDAAGKKTYRYAITGANAHLYDGELEDFIQVDYDVVRIHVEGRWKNTETLTASVTAGITTRIEAIENNINNGDQSFENIISRNIHKDSLVRSSGEKSASVESEIKPLSFIHTSDIHTKEDNYVCLLNVCTFLEHYENIEFAIITGDLVWDHFADPMDWYNIAVEKTTKPVLNVIGNHDSGQNTGATSLDKVSTDLQCYEKYIAPYVNKWGVVQPTNAANDGKSYYYKDFTEQKVRLVVLCEFETDFEINPDNPTQLKYSREYRAMRQEQVDWLISTLIETPSDYGVVVALHQPDTLKDEENAFVSYLLVDKQIANIYADDREWLLKILDAYQNKKALSFSFYQSGAVVGTINVNCDFTNTSSELICVICGHTHNDYIGHYKNYPSIRVLVVGANNLKYTGDVCKRKEGTPSEDMFNVVNIDRNRKKISVIRIGADGSVYGQYRNHIVVDY